MEARPVPVAAYMCVNRHQDKAQWNVNPVVPVSFVGEQLDQMRLVDFPGGSRKPAAQESWGAVCILWCMVHLLGVKL